MKVRHSSGIAALVLILMSSGQADPARTASASLEGKLHHIEANGALPHPNPGPTEMTEAEINAYVAAGKIQLPGGVQSVHFTGDGGAVTATSRVNFDQIKGGRNSSNPLLSVFSGVHDVEVEAHAHGVGHTGYVAVDSVELDGVEIPRFALQMFVEKYLRPRHPEIGLDNRFALPDKIDTATIGKHTMTVVQR